MTVCASCGYESAEAFKFCPECGASAVAEVQPREQRKTVTVLFCDVTGSTALGESTDPEALRAVLARYFERMKGIVESHGGTVEKFIGDAVMAVFGVPVLHEDDAIRAVRAALDMQEALPGLGVQARIGLNTGEVVTGTEERLATGDAVNVAARLEQAAQAGEVLIGETTLQLIREAVETEPVEPLELKGKAEPVAAFRLLALTGEPLRRHEAPLVGRDRERRLLADAWEHVRSERSCFLFTLLGPAGVGKSRLAAEFLAGVEARVVRGRCLSYGEGITYWPAVEVLTQLGVRPAEESAAGAIASVLGETDDATTPDEIAWAFRRTLEQAAAEAPLVCVFDDIHWAEPAFLDLLEHVADFSRESPILLLCIARPELLERREGWGGGKFNATAVLLEPLSAAETDELIHRLGDLDEALKERIRDAAEGNPLFVEEMLAMVREAGVGEVSVPPTIQALLAARLDQLDAPERAVLERGAVEGKVFHRGAVQALAPDEPQVPQRLMALVRKELVRPDRAVLPGDDAFRFRHLLIRDAAYDALPKAERAELHERFALWLEEHGADLVELDEILGYHLEQGCRYRAELGMPVDPELKAAARSRLTAAGRRASLRGDLAGVKLLERATSLVSEDEIDLGLELDLIDALFHAGRMSDASDRAGSLAERAAVVGQRVPELCGHLWTGMVRLYIDPEGAAESLDALAAQAVPIFEASEDDLALFLGHFAVGWVANMRAEMDKERDALEQALQHARRLELPHLEARLLSGSCASRVFGTTPVPATIAWVAEQEARGLRHPSLRGYRSWALAMEGRFDDARAILAGLRGELAERGAKIPLALHTAHSAVDLELLAGNPAAAVELGEEGCAMLEELGERSWLSTAVGKLAETYYELGRLEDADASAGRAAELGASDDAVTQMLWRQVRAKVLARRGELEEAEKLAREAVAIGETTDILDARGEAYLDLAEVLSLSGRSKEVAEELRQALMLYERKENMVMAERTRERLESLRSTT